MNEAKIYLLIIIGGVIFAPLIGHCLRERDFKRQLSGKRPERKAKKEIPMSEVQPMNFDVELIKEQTKIDGRNEMKWH